MALLICNRKEYISNMKVKDKMIDLQQGDCLELMQKVPDKSVDLVVTDPPYDVHAGHGGGAFGNRDEFSDILSMSDGINNNVLDMLCRKMKKINIYMFCSQKQILNLIDYFFVKRKCNWNLLTWHKTNPVPACNNKYLSDTEYIFFAREKGVPVYGDYATKHTFWVTPNNAKEKQLYGHPTVKPQTILHDLVYNSSQEQQIVMDPFMGSGSTGVACINTNRDFIGMELDEEYFKIAEQRINEAQRNVELF